MESNDEEDRRKRPRDVNSAAQAEDEGTEVKAALAHKLSKIPPLRCTQLQKAPLNLHTSRLDNARQILEMEQAKKDSKPPAGWKMQTLHMPAGSDTHKQAAELKMLKAYCECYDDMIASRQDATSQATADIQELIDNASTAQLHISQHVMLNNPDRYAGITEQHMQQRLHKRTQAILEQAEVDADLKAAKASTIQAAKKAKQLTASQDKIKQQQQSEGTCSISQMQQALDKQRDEFDKLLKAHKQPPKTKPKHNKPQAAAKGTNRKTAVHKGKGPSKKNKGKGNNKTQDKGHGGKAARSALSDTTNTRTPRPHKPFKWINVRARARRIANPPNHPKPITKSTVVNLSGKDIAPPTHSVLSLGPVFRPTPAPIADRKVTTAVRQFAKSIKTSAYFALNPDISTEP